MDWEKLSKELKIWNWMTLLILGAASFFFMNSDFTLGVILGGLMIIANFSILQRTIRSAFSPEGEMRSNKLAIIAKYYFRLAIMGIIIYILITQGWVNPIGLVVGLSIVVISIVHMGIRAVWKISSGEAV
jgi:hypothetical protein